MQNSKFHCHERLTQPGRASSKQLQFKLHYLEFKAGEVSEACDNSYCHRLPKHTCSLDFLFSNFIVNLHFMFVNAGCWWLKPFPSSPASCYHMLGLEKGGPQGGAMAKEKTPTFKPRPSSLLFWALLLCWVTIAWIIFNKTEQNSPHPSPQRKGTDLINFSEAWRGQRYITVNSSTYWRDVQRFPKDPEQDTLSITEPRRVLSQPLSCNPWCHWVISADLTKG